MKVVAVALLASLFPVVQASPPPGIFPTSGPSTSYDAARAISHHIGMSGAFAADLIAALARANLMDCLGTRPEALVEVRESSSPVIIDGDRRGCTLASSGPQPTGPRPLLTVSRREIAALVLAFDRWNVAPFFSQNDRDLAKYDVELEYRGSQVVVIFDPIRALLGANAEIAGCPHTGIAAAIFLFDRATLQSRPAHYAC